MTLSQTLRQSRGSLILNQQVPLSMTASVKDRVQCYSENGKERTVSSTQGRVWGGEGGGERGVQGGLHRGGVPDLAFEGQTILLDRQRKFEKGIPGRDNSLYEGKGCGRPWHALGDSTCSVWLDQG